MRLKGRAEAGLRRREAVLRDRWHKPLAACEREGVDFETVLAAHGVLAAELLLEHPDLADAWPTTLARHLDEERRLREQEPS